MLHDACPQGGSAGAHRERLAAKGSRNPPEQRVGSALGLGYACARSMAARRAVVSLSVTAAMTAVLAGCGSSARTPRLSALPLVEGANVVNQVQQCNQGSSAYCAIELVVLDPQYKSSHSLVLAERDRLRAQGWIGASPDTGNELADESPHHKLRVTYATAIDDLQGIDLGWIQRPWSIVSSLDSAIFKRATAMSVLLEVGSQ